MSFHKIGTKAKLLLLKSLLFLAILNPPTLVVNAQTLVHQLFKREHVDGPAWDTSLRTGEYTGTHRTLFECAAECNAMSGCNAMAYDGNTKHCEVSTKMHMFRLDDEGGKEIYMKPGALASPDVSMVQLRTATDPGDDGDSDTWLYAKVCLNGGSGPCCDSDVFDHPHDDYELGVLDSYDINSGLGACDGFIVPDYRTAKFYVRFHGSDNWGGHYLNYWFESNAWHLRCVNPAGGKIYLYGVMTFELSCSIGDNDNP